jgi:hypothetical protein
LLVVCITSLVLLLTWGGVHYAWGSGTILVLAAVSATTLAGFVLAQSRAAQPVLPPHLFRSRNFTLMTVLSFTNGFVMFGAVFYLPLYQQAVDGASAAGSGLLLLPMLGSLVVVSQSSGRFLARTGNYRVLQVGGSAAMLLGALMLARVGTSTPRPAVELSMALLGAGMGSLGQNVVTVAQNSVDLQEVGVAAAAITLFRTLGNSVGVALMGTRFNGRVRAVMAERTGGTVSLRQTRLDAKGLHRLGPGTRAVYRAAVAEGVRDAFVLGSAVAALAFVTALLVRQVALRTTRGPRP